MARWLWLSLAVLTLDQVSKWLALAWLELHAPVPVIGSYFYLTLMFNEGAAFSLLSDAGGWQRWLLAAFALAMAAFLLNWLLRLQGGGRLLAIGLALIIGGALGNLVDRILYGHVVDFIQVYVPVVPLAIFNPWPAFNVADSAISVGVTLLLITTVWGESPEPPRPGRS